MGTAQVYRDNGDRQPFRRLNINFGSISSSKRFNFLNGWVAFTFGVPMTKKQHNKYISKENPKFA